MKILTLQDTMRHVLIEKDGRLKIKNLVEIIKKHMLYTRINGQTVPITQIKARVRTYQEDFIIENDEIRMGKDEPEQLRFEKHRQEIIQQLKGQNPDLRKRIMAVMDKLENLFKAESINKGNPLNEDQKDKIFSHK